MNKPLADLLRPQYLDDLVGQNHLTNEHGLVRKMISNHQLMSLICFGPSGTGKTSLALIITNVFNLPYGWFNAAIDDKKLLIKLIEQAKNAKNGFIIILEEIHRLNKDKQDILLPYLENGTITIIASTTENPYFVINPAIRSRCQIIQFYPLNKLDIFNAVKKLIVKHKLKVNIPDRSLALICNYTNGDFRSTINIVDLIQKLYPNEVVDEKILPAIFTNANLTLDKDGNEHYNLLSALHKSLRGSDVNASLYYLGQLLLQKDFNALERRLIACCYEDVGLANPSLCTNVVNAINAAKIVGWPENKQIYASVVIQIAISPKSNSAIKAIENVLNHLEKYGNQPIPIYLRDAHYNSAIKLGIKGYKYPHDYGGYVVQQYLPEQIKNKVFYQPNKNGIEPQLNSWIELIKKSQ